jgi:hypothetical protein
VWAGGGGGVGFGFGFEWCIYSNSVYGVGLGSSLSRLCGLGGLGFEWYCTAVVGGQMGLCRPGGVGVGVVLYAIIKGRGRKLLYFVIFFIV